MVLVRGKSGGIEDELGKSRAGKEGQLTIACFSPTENV